MISRKYSATADPLRDNAAVADIYAHAAPAVFRLLAHSRADRGNLGGARQCLR